MHIVICDDNHVQAENLKNTIALCSPAGEPLQIEIYNSGDDFIASYQKKSSIISAVFLDIIMPGLNGIETAKSIRKINMIVPIIFVTSDPSYAIDGYDVDAISYITKPIDKRKLQHVLNKVQNRQLSINEATMQIISNGLLYNVTKSAIYYIEKSGRKTLFHLTGKNPILCNSSIQVMKKRIEEERYFAICCQTNYVNLHYIKLIDSQNRKIYLNNDRIIPLSRERVKPLMQLFLDYLGEK